VLLQVKQADPKAATLSIWVSAIDLPFGWVVKAALTDLAARERSVSRAAQIQRALHAFSDSIIDRDDLPDTYQRFLQVGFVLRPAYRLLGPRGPNSAEIAAPIASNGSGPEVTVFYFLVLAGSGSTMSPLRGNSSRGMRCVVPGKGGSRTSSPEVPLGSSGSSGGFVCIGDAPQMGVADSRTPRAQNQGRKAQTSRRDLADRAPATTHVDPCRGTRSWCTEAHASNGCGRIVSQIPCPRWVLDGVSAFRDLGVTDG
jgi:hypothetical protein